MIGRRGFLGALGGSAIAPAQEGPPREERVEQLTARAAPSIALNHLGFEPGARKIVVVRGTGPAEFVVRDIGSPPQPVRLTFPLKKTACDFGDALTGDFSELRTEAMYQLTAGEERSVPFFIRPDVWRRTLPRAVGYVHAQRCGAEVPGFHPACHLDDARRRDNGEHVEVTGGWHDAGDLRKWMSATMMSGFALLELARTLGNTWDPAASGTGVLLEEFRWGNRYFQKMQDEDGLVWADAAGGVNGDNSDNHWTDNRIGTPDDRYVNPSKQPAIQAMFTALQAAAAQVFRPTEQQYAEACLNAALRCWNAAKRGDSTAELCGWTRAALELHRATGESSWEAEGAGLARKLIGLQARQYAHGQKVVRGFWQMGARDAEPYNQAVHGALPALTLLDMLDEFEEHDDAGRWRDAVRMHIDDYVVPLAARNSYRIVPFGIFLGSPTPEHYRPLAGQLTYRYFMPVRKQFWWLGTNSHLLSYALLLARAGRVFEKPEYRDLALRQCEWMLGANPFGASLMTGEGMRNPYPHSRFVGPIPGGIMNGIAGNAKDEPVLDTELGFDWRTTEYWSPHNSYYIRAVAALAVERAAGA